MTIRVRGKSLKTNAALELLLRVSSRLKHLDEAEYHMASNNMCSMIQLSIRILRCAVTLMTLLTNPWPGHNTISSLTCASTLLPLLYDYPFLV